VFFHFEQTHKWIYVYERKSAIIDQDNKEKSSIQPSYHVTGVQNDQVVAIVVMVPNPHLQARRLYILSQPFILLASGCHAPVLIIGVLVVLYSQYLLECFLVTSNILAAIL
jgi:hypothetical protein